MNKTDELRTARIESLITPAELAQRHPVSPEVAAHVTASRQRIEKILNGEDRRLLAIVGPCSIHDLDAAMERIEMVAAPINNKRLDRPNPCTITGMCMDCQGSTRLCNITTILHKRPPAIDFHVVVVGEELGF